MESGEALPPEGLAACVAACLKGVVVAGGEHRLLLDVRRLVTGEDEVAAVVEAVARGSRQIGSESAERRDQSS